MNDPFVSIPLSFDCKWIYAKVPFHCNAKDDSITVFRPGRFLDSALHYLFVVKGVWRITNANEHVDPHAFVIASRCRGFAALWANEFTGENRNSRNIALQTCFYSSWKFGLVGFEVYGVLLRCPVDDWRIGKINATVLLRVTRESETICRIASSKSARIVVRLFW